MSRFDKIKKLFSTWRSFADENSTSVEWRSALRYCANELEHACICPDEDDAGPAPTGMWPEHLAECAPCRGGNFCDRGETIRRLGNLVAAGPQAFMSSAPTSSPSLGEMRAAFAGAALIGLLTTRMTDAMSQDDIVLSAVTYADKLSAALGLDKWNEMKLALIREVVNEVLGKTK